VPPQGTIQVEIEGSDEEEHFDEGPNRDHVPDTITRDMISKHWKYVDPDIKSRFILNVNNLEHDGGAVLGWCMGLDPDMDEDFTNPFSPACLYRTGLRATGVGSIPMKRLLFADLITGQVGTLKERKAKADEAQDDPDADFANLIQMPEAEWLLLSPEVQATKLGSRCKRIAWKGKLCKDVWKCSACKTINTPAEVCALCQGEREQNFGGLVIPTLNKESIDRLQSFYLEGRATYYALKKGRRVDKKRQATSEASEASSAWYCTGGHRPHAAAWMPLLSQRCSLRACNMPRPADLEE